MALIKRNGELIPFHARFKNYTRSVKVKDFMLHLLENDNILFFFNSVIKNANDCYFRVCIRISITSFRSRPRPRVIKYNQKLVYDFQTILYIYVI